MGLTLLVMTDGRPHIDETLPAAVAMIHPDRVVIHDDSGDARVHRRLSALGADVLVTGPRRLGLAGAVARAWSAVAAEPTSHVFHLEDDFYLTEAPVLDMIDVLDANGYAQVSLKRQPINGVERKAGGWMEQHPDWYSEVEHDGRRWCHHRRWFSLNPCVYQVDIPRRYSWPQVPDSEQVFSRQICAERPSAVWGGFTDPPRVRHIGKRVGCGY
jgi:hypothetical protein